ncbi:MAG: hypothetical protein UY90_C0088G0004 [Candidatus Peregrinibacteria bacterium GW2011_GWA2_54_9]|nr:MAG: hypothetical protein UY90_C0088G0004 [Candidatus Peregrinibacteria bacterium GW2011_GWA2_54_9]
MGLIFYNIYIICQYLKGPPNCLSWKDGAPRGVKGKALPNGRTPTNRLRILAGADEEAQGRVEELWRARRFGSTFVAGQRWICSLLQKNAGPRYMKHGSGTSRRNERWPNHSPAEKYNHLSISSITASRTLKMCRPLFYEGHRAEAGYGISRESPGATRGGPAPLRSGPMHTKLGEPVRDKKEK